MSRTVVATTNAPAAIGPYSAVAATTIARKPAIISGQLKSAACVWNSAMLVGGLIGVGYPASFRASARLALIAFAWASRAGLASPVPSPAGVR